MFNVQDQFNLAYKMAWAHFKNAEKRTVRRTTERRPITVRRRIGRWRLSCEVDVKIGPGKIKSQNGRKMAMEENC
jgi:hypothetical protein